MPIGYSRTVALRGLEGSVIEVQADISPGLPGLAFTGLGDLAVVQARERVRSAISNSHIAWPNRRITMALLPADVRKVGSRFDLAMAIAIVIASDSTRQGHAMEIAWIAELGLDGRLRPVNGVLPSVVIAQRAGCHRIVVAAENAAEAAIVPGVQVYAPSDLRAAVEWLRGERRLGPVKSEATQNDFFNAGDLTDVLGQQVAKRAFEVSAAGGHHVFLQGSPGAGKTMLAQRLPTLLPELDDPQALEVSSVHSIAGVLPPSAGLIRRPPFQAPHHSASLAAMVGGGSGIAAPGAISLAHHGVLFLDEAPQFVPAVLDALRQPLESGRVVLHRSGGIVDYPARFLLVLASNPCPCARRRNECECPPAARHRYQQRLSGPLLDRIDIRLQVEPVPRAVLLGDGDAAERGETSDEVASRVRQARAAAHERWKQLGVGSNAHVSGSVLRTRRWRLSAEALHHADKFLERGQLTARGFDRVLRLSWTLADLAGRVAPAPDDVGEALFLRMGTAAA